MSDAELLALHRELVSIASPSRDEAALRAWLVSFLRAKGLGAEALGDNVFAVTHGEGRALCLCSHLDTVPASPGWTRPPLAPTVEDGKVYGLGSNDAKASVAAMIAALLRLKDRPGAPPLVLALCCQEETGGKGAESLVPHLCGLDAKIAAAVVGEPTGLEIAVAQKGLLVLELKAAGRACHAAHARALGVPNPVRALAADLLALDSVELGAADPDLGPVTLEPTVLHGGTARNMLPAQASCILDVRSNPSPGHAELVARLRGAVKGELGVLSDRLLPCAVDAEHPLVRAARAARPEARLFGSRGVSDWVFFQAAGIAAIKVGPGQTERSHTPDEFVLEKEVIDGARFYEALALAWAKEAWR
ncbi:MAG: M20/M25/M40 family metallo-hydrolase [Myxococcales bacterium]